MRLVGHQAGMYWFARVHHPVPNDALFEQGLTIRVEDRAGAGVETSVSVTGWTHAMCMLSSFLTGACYEGRSLTQLKSRMSATQLITVGFSRLQPRMTMARTLKLYRLPEAPLTPGLRQLRAEDAPQVRVHPLLVSLDPLTALQRPGRCRPSCTASAT